MRRGRRENTSVTSVSGHGIQVLSAEGRSALASRDDFHDRPALELLARTIEAAGRGRALGLAAATLPTLEPTTARAVPVDAEAFERVDLAAAGERLAALEAQIVARVPGVNQPGSMGCRISGVAPTGVP